MARTTKQSDLAKSIMERIISTPVPDAGQLKHPIQPKKRASGQVTLNDILIPQAEPEISTWGTRDFVDYFAKRYQEETGGNYRRVYKADCGIFQQIIKFMASNGLASREWTKNAIDWGFRKRDQIVNKRGAFTPLEILSLINYFYQEEVLPKAETGQVVRVMGDMSLLEEIDTAMSQGKERQLFLDFGIPVTATYMVRVRGFREAIVETGIDKLLENLAANGVAEREKMGRIFMASVIGSPYPDGFVLLDWREKFATYLAPFRREDWFRSQDYACQPLPKYYALLGKKD